MTMREETVQGNPLDDIGFGCNYIPFSSKHNPCAPKAENRSLLTKPSNDLSADEHADKLFQFCGQDVFARSANSGDLTEEDIQDIVHSPCCCSEEEIRMINEREIHLSFGGD